MIKAILHFLKIHRKVIFGNPTVVIQDMLGITPKSFNAVNMVLTTIGQGFGMIQAMVFAPALQRVVAPKGVRVIDGSFSGMLPDMSHQLISRHLFHYLSVNPPIALQQAKYNAFTLGTTTAFSFASAAEVGLINLNLALQLTRLQLRHMIDGFAQMLVDAGHYLVIQTQITGHAVSRLLLVKTGNDADLFAQPLKRLLFSTAPVPAFHITALGPIDLERTAENTLSTPQKVGRTVENILLPSNHKGILAPRGYEIH